MPLLEAEREKGSNELNGSLTEIPNLPLDEVPDGKDENDNVEHHRFGAKRIILSRPSNISNLAKRSARWISRPRPSFPGRALLF